MESYKSEFIDFMVESDVLKFGDFTLKSGRKSPFFMNAGAYVTGSQLKRLGEYYAKAIHDNYGDDFDVLFFRHIRESHLRLSQRSHTVNYMEKKSVTAQTERKQKTTELTRAVSSEAA